MTISVRVNNISFSYRERRVLDSISFDIKPGTFLTIIGPNGSGKSTLLKNISSILTPSQGVVMVEERDIRELSKREIAQRIASVPQSTNIDFNFTAHDIVLMGRHPFKRKFQGENSKDYSITKRTME